MSTPLPYNSAIPLSLIVLIAVFYLGTMREGHSWGDDFALYVLHAESIVEGKGYAETPYVHNPSYPDIGPKAYPPVVPMALVPAYEWFGLNVTVMKITLCAFFLAALWVLFWMYRTILPWPYAAGLIFLLGFNPYFYDFKDEIASDLPFMFFVWVTLYAAQRYYDSRETDRLTHGVSCGILVGACMYLAYGTRVIGAVLPVSLFLYELMKFKKLSRFAVTAFFVAGTLIAVQATLLSAVGSGYFSVLKDNTAGDIANLLLGNAITYLTSQSTFLDNGHSKLIKIGLFVMVSVLAALGLRRRIKDGITILEVFLFLYLVVLVMAPFQAFRYLFPIIPIYFFYACLGALETGSLLRCQGFQYTPVLIAGLVVLSYASKYATLDYGPIHEGIARQESKELFQHIQAHTKADDVIIFRKPRALALMTGRHTSIYPMPSSNQSSWDGEAWDYFHHIGARYLVVGATAWARNPVRSLDIEWERQFVERYKDRCEQVFSNVDFQVYELSRCKDQGIMNTAASQEWLLGVNHPKTKP